MNESLPSFPGHSDVKTYLEQYFEHYKLNQFVQFGTLVEQVLPVPTGSNIEDGTFDTVKWSVTTHITLSNGRRRTEEFDSVLICNG